MRYADVIMADNPVGLWMLQERVSPVAAQGLGVVGDATYQNGPTLGVPGPSGAIPYAVALNGVDQFVLLPTIPYLAAGNAQTWEIWSYSTTDHTLSTGVRTLFGSTAATFQALGLGGDFTGGLTNEVVTVGNDAGGANERTGWTGGTIQNRWHHHVFTFNGGQGSWRYYLDGAEWTLRPGVSQISNAGGARGLISAQFTIGRVVGSYSNWQGVAAAAIYRYSLTPAAIARHFAAGKNGRRPEMPTRLSRR